MRRAVTGLRAWLLQRASAVFMMAFIAAMLVRFLFDRPLSYPAWRDWMLAPVPSIATVVFFAALIVHAWVGLRDVVMDYVKPVARRGFVLALLALGLLALGASVIRILLLRGA